jgi:hypothetical protein
VKKKLNKKAPLSTLSGPEYEARLRKILLGALGKAWMFWPPRAEVKRRTAVPGKPGWHFCEQGQVPHRREDRGGPHRSVHQTR